MNSDDPTIFNSLLVGECRAWARDYSLDAIGMRVQPPDKWLARSALQKAVRRGQTKSSAEIALGLAELDSPYTWRAIETIAVEDVGFGSPDCVTWAVASSSPQFRKRVGERLLLSALVGAMCASVKTRSACELSWIVDTDWPELLREARSHARAELVRRVAHGGPVETYAALMALRGMSPTSPRLRQHDEEGVRLACEVMREQLPASHARASVAAFRKPLDTMSVACFPVFRVGHDLAEVEIVRDQLPPSLPIGSYVSEALDQHERRGRSAIRVFATHLSKESTALARLSAKGIFGAVADAVFIEEGAMLDQWVSGGQLSRLRAAADDLSMTRHGISAEQGIEIRKLVASNLEMLNQHRRAVVEQLPHPHLRGQDYRRQ